MDYGAYFIFNQFHALRAVPHDTVGAVRNRINLRDITGHGRPDAKLLVSWDSYGIRFAFLSAVPICKELLEDTPTAFDRQTHVEFFLVPDASTNLAYRILIKPSGASACETLRYGETVSDTQFSCRINHQIHSQFWECGAFVTYQQLGMEPARPGDIWQINCFYLYYDAYGMRFFSGLSDERLYASGKPAQIVHDYRNFPRLYFDNEPICHTRKLVQGLSQAEDTFEEIDPQKTAALRTAGDNVTYIALFRQLQEQQQTTERVSLLAGKTSFLQHQAQDRDFSVSLLPTAIALKRDVAFYRQLRPLPSILHCSAAKGEAESFQLVIAATPEAASTVALKWEGEVGMPDFEWGEVRDVTAFDSFQGPACTGSFSEIIMDTSPDAVQVPYASYTPLFCRFTVPHDSHSGRYRGKLRLFNGTGEIIVHVELTVRSFVLPVQTSIPVVFCFFEDFYRRWFELDIIPDKTRENIFRFLLKYRLSPNDIYNKELYPSIANLVKFMPHGLNFCTLGYLSLNKDELTKKRLNELTAEFRKRWEAVKAAGAQDICYFYSYDELFARGQKDTACRLLKRLQREIPELKCLQTSPYMPEMANCFNIWIPTFDRLAESRRHAAEDDADPEFWWYSADGPEKPYPNYHLGYPLMDLRMVMTLSWKNRIKGILHWCINREWTANAVRREEIENNPSNWDPAFQSALSTEEVRRCGMGNYLYPAPNGTIYPSLRLENLRDSIEDYEYYVLLRKLCEAPNADPELRAQAEKLLAIPPEIAASTCDYTNDPDLISAFREQVADLIEQMQPFSS